MTTIIKLGVSKMRFLNLLKAARADNVNIIGVQNITKSITEDVIGNIVE